MIMTEKENLESLITSFGLDPFRVEKYDVKSNETSKTGQGWRGKGIDENNEVVISFCEPDGINAAISEINVQALSAGLSRVLVE